MEQTRNYFFFLSIKLRPLAVVEKSRKSNSKIARGAAIENIEMGL